MRTIIFVCILVWSSMAVGLEEDIRRLNEDISCLTKNMFYEARDQSVEGWLAIAEVTLNRKKHHRFPDSVCDVVYQPSRDRKRPKACQFSWTCSGVEGNVDLSNPIERRALNTIQLIAIIIIVADSFDVKLQTTVEGANHHVECSISQNRKGFWNRTDFLRKIGDHCFYKER